jgi:ubiquinone/menaquinone biosynthesis C-methylase UbiE
MARHFRTLAPRYRELREFDVRVVHRVLLELQYLSDVVSRVNILDVGAGTGRYTEAVVQHAAESRLCYHGVACDAIREMLGSRVVHHLPGTGIIDHVIGFAESLPFVARSFNAVLSFNAIHHFDLSAFLAEVARVLLPCGRLIVYTRTPEQNRHTIWGKCFPHFAERETRLYTESTLHAAVCGMSELELLDLLEMPWMIRTNLARLRDQARSSAYSTFRFYSPDEFEEALGVFEARVRADFDDVFAITAPNDHLLVLVARR